MKPSLVLPSYIQWHYTDALRNIWGILTNFVWFFYNFFSVPLLLKTLIAPWHTLETGENAFGNFISYAFGFMIRGAIIVFAYAIIIGIFFIGIAFYIFWLTLPLTLIFLFTASVNFLSI